VFFAIESKLTDLITIVELEDGSTITLYKDANFTTEDFVNQRVIKFSGKGYFDVKPDDKRPFVVYTDEAMITVVGTSFVVDTEKDMTTEIMVNTGVVLFSQNQERVIEKAVEVELNAGERGEISLNARGVIKRKNREANYMAWSDQVLTFNDNSMQEVADLVNSVYGYEITFVDEKFKTCLLTAKISRKSAKELATILAETFGVSFNLNKENKTIVFSGKGC
jgi:ferric-dicitrate binding protein FerR (iron transport regulator)